MTGRFRFLLSAYFLSSAGDWISRLAIPLLLYHITGSALCLSLAYAMTFLPFVFVTPIGGVLADAVDRRTLLVVADSGAAGLMLTMAVSATIAPDTAWPFFPLLFLLFSLVAIYHPAFQSYIPSLLREADLSRGNAAISAVDNLTNVLGPLLGGALIAAVGPEHALYVDAASFLVSAVCIYGSEARPLTLRLHRTTATRWHDDLREGARYVLRHPVLRCGCLLFTATNLGLTLFTANLMFFLISDLRLGSLGVGMVLGVSGGGAILGSLVAPWLNRRLSQGFILTGANIVAGLAILLLASLRLPLAVAVVWGIVLAMNSIVVVTFFTLRQRIVPTELLGRAVATTRSVSFLAVPVGSVLGGWLVDQSASVMPAILLSGAIVTVAGCAALLTSLNAPVPRAYPAE
jgi:predicted MFS family arabinose efflux permease